MSNEKLREIAHDYAKNLLSLFKGKIEYSNDEVERINNIVAYYTVRFRRIFDHGIVLGNVSYVSLTVDGDGNLCTMEVKWPTFKKIQKAESAINLDVAIDSASAAYSEAFEAEREGERVYSLKANIEGVSLGWTPLFSDKGPLDILTPCYAFKAIMSLSNNESTPNFIEVPRLAKYLYD
ncbi:MAG: hypothetical protein JW795_06305 [Chitinivibrionales bacterium]|nr:hypothetical protein [Chitinivibrionales bacterium]